MDPRSQLDLWGLLLGDGLHGLEDSHRFCSGTTLELVQSPSSFLSKSLGLTVLLVCMRGERIFLILRHIASLGNSEVPHPTPHTHKFNSESKNK